MSGNYKGLLIGGGAMILAFAWKVALAILLGVFILFTLRKFIDRQYEKTLDGKWD